MIVSNAALRAVTGTNLPSFITGRNVGNGFGANGTNNSWEFTAKELIDLALGGSGGMSADWRQRGIMEAVKKNFDQYGMSSIGTMILTPIAFRLGRQVLSKPLINPANRALKSLGVKEVKF